MLCLRLFLYPATFLEDMLSYDGYLHIISPRRLSPGILHPHMFSLRRLSTRSSLHQIHPREGHRVPRPEAGEHPHQLGRRAAETISLLLPLLVLLLSQLLLLLLFILLLLLLLLILLLMLPVLILPHQRGWRAVEA